MGTSTKSKQEIQRQKPKVPTTTKIPTTFQQKCDWIAKLSEEILQDPQNAFSPYQEEDNNIIMMDYANNDSDNDEDNLPRKKKYNKIKILLEVASSPIRDKNDIVSSVLSSTITQEHPQQQERNHLARLAMVSLLAIFSDILPSYRIRLPTREELSIRVSRETKATWDYERNLLTHYQMYLKVLQRTWEEGNTKSNHHKISLLTATSMLCTCELLKHAMHFNFRSTILQIVVRNMNYNCKRILLQRYSMADNTELLASSQHPTKLDDDDDDEIISIKCCEAVSYIFQTDKQGDISLEAVRVISKLIKDTSSNSNGHTTNWILHPRILQTFLDLPLRIHEEDAEAVKLHTAANAKRRKRNREEATIEEELKEGNASLDKGLLARSQAESLHLVTLAYFRIIKKAASIYETTNEDESSHPKQNRQKQQHQQQYFLKLLLPVTLQGLAKFAHLINIDTVVDLLAVLKDLLQNVDKLPLEAALNCVLTAFKTLLGPGKELQIDPKEYITPLFAQLPRLCSFTNCLYANLALQCIDSAFIRRRDYSLSRVAAFIKQLLTVSLHAPSPYCSATPFIAMVRSMLNSKYSTGVANRLLENEVDNATSLGGAYNPTADDPERTNPFATSAWELGMLRFHIHPDIAQQADDCANLRLVQREGTPMNLYNDLVQHSLQGYIIPSKIIIKRHPLSQPYLNNKEMKKRKRTPQVRFITPRITKLTHLNGAMEQDL